jgi:hypothetical protein
MPKSATDIMQEIVVSAVLDGVDALKSASKGLPNSLLRDINAMHANATLADLPQEVQRAIAASVQSAFVRLRKEGYAVAPQDAVRPVVSRPAPPSGPGARPGPGNRPRPPWGGARPPGQDRERRPPQGPRGNAPRGPKKPGSGR